VVTEDEKSQQGPSRCEAAHEDGRPARQSARVSSCHWPRRQVAWGRKSGECADVHFRPEADARRQLRVWLYPRIQSESGDVIESRNLRSPARPQGLPVQGARQYLLHQREYAAIGGKLVKPALRGR
jgi:hypothetical protein